MLLQEEDLQEFCQIWQNEFKEVLSKEEAQQHASLLLELYSLLIFSREPNESEVTSHEKQL